MLANNSFIARQNNLKPYIVIKNREAERIAIRKGWAMFSMCAAPLQDPRVTTSSQMGEYFMVRVRRKDNLKISRSVVLS